MSIIVYSIPVKDVVARCALDNRL